MPSQIQRTKLTPLELAQRWGCSAKTVLGFIRSGELRTVNLAKAGAKRPRYMIDEADIEAFEQAREVAPNEMGASTAKMQTGTAT